MWSQAGELGAGRFGASDLEENGSVEVDMVQVVEKIKRSMRLRFLG
jgi:hypothetical protein